MNRKQLIVNADDFGFSTSVNAGIVAAHQRGIVSSTSMMVGMPAAAEAAALAKQNPQLGVGLHINLSCGAPLAPADQVRSLVDGRGQFLPIGKLLLKLQLGLVKQADLEREIDAQFGKFAALGLTCTHFDGHRHVHCVPRVFRVAMHLAAKHGVDKCRISVEASPHAGAAAAPRSLPYWSQWAKAQLLDHWGKRCRRLAQNSGLRFPENFFGITAMSATNRHNVFVDLLGACREGSNEIMCHPAQRGSQYEFMEGYDIEVRQTELTYLTDDTTRQRLNAHGLQLTSFSGL